MDDLFREASPEGYGDKFQDHVLEQYKLYVELTDRAQQRRIAASSSDILLVVNTLIAATAAAGNTGSLVGLDGFPTLVVGLTGLLVCLAWAQRIDSYRSLLAARFQVLNEIEKMLPLPLHASEWKLLATARPYSSYLPRINLEVLMPRLFAVLHVVLIALALG